MAQSSGPISQGTTGERQFTDVQWRDRFGDEPGVIGDLDGTAYALNLSGGGDIVNVGSSTQASLATVAGFVHRIPQSSPEPITIPVAVGSARTDIIGLRYDPAYTGLPGPVRLYRTVGSSASIPAYDSAPPGVEDLPLFAITRSPSQALSLATVQRMFPRIAPALEMPTGQTLPTSSPLGTVLRQGRARYRRDMVSGSAAWVSEDIPVLASIAARNTYFSGALTAGVSALVAGDYHVYDGSAWRFTLSGQATVTTNSSATANIAHGAGQVPTSVQVTLLDSGDTFNPILKWMVQSVDVTNIQVRAVRTDSSTYLGNNGGLKLYWTAKF